MQNTHLRADVPNPLVTGAFIQFSDASAQAGTDWWEGQLAAMSAVGIDTLVVQYAASDDTYYFPLALKETEVREYDAVENVLDGARKHQIGVFLGLHMDHSFWSNSFDMSARVNRNKATLSALYSRYKSHPALKGWYIPEEIDDLTVEKDYAESLLEYFGDISSYARERTHLPVMISPFFGRDVDPVAYARWWDEVALPAMSIEVLALQDGIGTHRTSLERARSVYEALCPVAKKHGVAFWANNETFDQIHGWPVDDKAWAAVPADFSRFQRQIQATSPFVEKTITFEFTHYMNPQVEGKSHDLYQAYRQYYLTNKRAHKNGTKPSSAIIERIP
jgi:sugar phosphate isomerase/epimerase